MFCVAQLLKFSLETTSNVAYKVDQLNRFIQNVLMAIDSTQFLLSKLYKIIYITFVALPLNRHVQLCGDFHHCNCNSDPNFNCCTPDIVTLQLDATENRMVVTAFPSIVGRVPPLNCV